MDFLLKKGVDNLWFGLKSSQAKRGDKDWCQVSGWPRSNTCHKLLLSVNFGSVVQVSVLVSVLAAQLGSGSQEQQNSLSSSVNLEALNEPQPGGLFKGHMLLQSRALKSYCYFLSLPEKEASEELLTLDLASPAPGRGIPFALRFLSGWSFLL